MLAAALSAAAAAEPGAIDLDHFPRFPTIEPNVAFWTRTYAEWSLGEVAVHDLDYPAVVYEVVPLPGNAGESYTDAQRDFVDALRDRWRDRLRSLAGRVAAGDALDEADKALTLRIVEAAGSEALAGAAERVRTQRGLRERFRRGIEISHRYDAVFREIFREAGLPEDLAYLPHVESSFQAAARSSAGAVGIWQFTRGTGRRFMSISSALDERLDPIAAARAAARYLSDAHAALGDWPLALTSYNHGVGGMLRAKQEIGGDYERVFREYRGRLFGFASRNFYAEFLAARDIASDPERFFPEGLSPEPVHDLEDVRLERRMTPSQIARTYRIELRELASLNPAWSRRAVRDGLALPVGATVWLPPGTSARRRREAADRATDRAAAAVLDGEYIVRAGDTLSSIAASQGVEIGRLRRLNSIPAGSSLIRAGQRLRVVDPAGETSSRVHVVRRGDTLFLIAVRHGVRLADLLLLNGLSETSVIHPGQQLHIPGLP